MSYRQQLNELTALTAGQHSTWHDTQFTTDSH